MKKSKRLLAVLLVLVIVALGIISMPKIYRQIRFSTGNLTPAEKTVKEYADKMGISVSAYPQSLIELLDRNPETKEFVLEYPFREKVTPTLSQYDRTQGIPLFLQWDPQWGYEKYGSDMIAITGCGPTCLAMAGYYLTGKESFTPDQVAAFAERSGYYSRGHGSSWTLISEGGKKLGLDVTEIPLAEKRIMDNLEAGNPIICVVGPGDFTSTGHFIVLSGCRDGKIMVNDPNSRKNSQELWSYEQLAPQIKNLWVLR